jgi:hypothetical protein
MLGRLEAIDPAEMGGRAQRTSHVGADLEWCHACREGGCCTTARSTRCPLRVPGVGGSSEDRIAALVEVGQPRRHVGVADDVGARGAQPRAHRSIGLRNPVALDGTDGGTQAGNFVGVFERQRHAVQRTPDLATC